MDSNNATPTLWLLPSTLSDAPTDNVLPALNFEVAKRLRHFIVENVRTARRFLRRCDPGAPIDEMTFHTLDTHTEAADIPAMLSPMVQGHDMGVISEAGCPAVADPGAVVVGIALERGYRVMPLVGPSSIILGLMASGFNGQSFAFTGYLPIDSATRNARLREMERRIMRESQTQIFIETPYRNNRLIGELAQALPRNLRLCVCCDLTGPTQTVTNMTLGQWVTARYDYAKRPAIFLLYK